MKKQNIEKPVIKRKNNKKVLKKAVPAKVGLTDAVKDKVLDCIDRADGVVCSGLRMAGVSESTYYRQKRNDPDFAGRVEEIKMRVQMQKSEREEDDLDATEAALNELIYTEKNFNAIKFKLETKGRKRGWTKRDPQPIRQVVALPEADIKELIKQKEEELTESLKEVGKYTPELRHQINLTAGVIVRREKLMYELFATNSINIEQQRDGTFKEAVSPKEKVYSELVQLENQGYKALGLNLLSKERKPDTDGLGEFLESLNMDDDRREGDSIQG